MGSKGLYRAFLGIIGLYYAVLGSTRLYWLYGAVLY